MKKVEIIYQVVQTRKIVIDNDQSFFNFPKIITQQKHESTLVEETDPEVLTVVWEK